jgi:hypothetical protein
LEDLRHVRGEVGLGVLLGLGRISTQAREVFGSIRARCWALAAEKTA